MQVVEPTPPQPPPPPAVTASMAPASASVLIGNNVVFAVNASGGVAGDAASWTCASSNSGIASVSVVSAGCQATGVAAGSVTVTATVTKSGETVNVGAQLTVTEEAAGDPAFIILASVKDSTEDDNTLSGRVTATVNVERGDQELEEVALLVDGEVVASQSFGSDMDMGMAPPDDAAEQAVHAFTLSFNSAAYDDHGHPDYTNAEHTISATLEIGVTMADGMHGHETLSSNAITAEFDNDDAVHVSVSGLGDGALNTSTGQLWHGGPDFALKVAAMPVMYSGGTTAAVTLRRFCGGNAITDSEAPYEFSPKCGSSYVSGTKGDSLTFNIGGDDVSKVVGADKLFLDFKGPGAPTFNPNPNGRELGWINADAGITSTSGKEAWLAKGADDMGVGGYIARLRYAAKPSSGSVGSSAHVKAALAATPSTSLPAEHKTPNNYCVFASAVDRLGNESALPKADDATCEIAGVKATTGDNPQSATGYVKVLANGKASSASKAATDSLANAGILAGVDLTAPSVEFLTASVKDKATELGDSPSWGLYVADRIGATHSKVLDVSIKVRDATKTTTFKHKAGESAAPDSFAITNDENSLRHMVKVLGASAEGARRGYYTFSATAKDKAGNKSAPASRVALHDGTAPPMPGLFLTPATVGYNSIVVLTEDLSIKSYSTTVKLPTIGGASDPELVAGGGDVDEYNAASLTRSKTVQGTVSLPYRAIQVNTSDPVTVNEFKAYATNQAKASTGAMTTVAVDTTGVGRLTFRSEGGLTVAVSDTTVMKTEKSLKVTVTAQLTDAATNLDAPFSAVGLYAKVGVSVGDGTVNQLRQVGIVPATAAKTKLGDNGRDWTYEATLSADAIWDVVKDTVTGSYSGEIVAFGVAPKGLVVANSSTAVTLSKRD